MPFRQIELPGVGCHISSVMGAPSSSDAQSHETALEAYYRRGGSCLHLHGEGGETHSRLAVGQWLARNALRSRFYLCTQICHDDWDEANQRPIDRFNPEGVHADISTDLDLLSTEYLDLVYLDDSPELDFVPVLQSLAEELNQGRVRAYGVRNWSPARIRAAIEFANAHTLPPISAIITTELSLLETISPLWPGYVPFDADLRKTALDFRLLVFAHIDDAIVGQHLIGDEGDAARMRNDWRDRWEAPVNSEIAMNIRVCAAALGRSAREVNLAWVFNQPFPVIGIVGLPALARYGDVFEQASNLALNEIELSLLAPMV